MQGIPQHRAAKVEALEQRVLLTTVAGNWTGTMTEHVAGIPSQYSLNVRLAQSGQNVTGMELIEVVGWSTAYYGLISLHGTVTSTTFTFQEDAITDYRLPAGYNWLIKSGTLQISTDGLSMKGPWYSEGYTGTFTLNHVSGPTQSVDLGLSALSFSPNRIDAGAHPTAVSYTITNYGPADLNASPIVVSLYLSKDAVFGNADDIAIGKDPFDNEFNILSGAAYAKALTAYGDSLITVPTTVPEGDYYVFARVQLDTDTTLGDPNSSNDVTRSSGRIHVHGEPAAAAFYDTAVASAKAHPTPAIVSLANFIASHEGEEPYVYPDQSQIPTIGYGFNLTTTDAKATIDTVLGNGTFASLMASFAKTESEWKVEFGKNAATDPTFYYGSVHWNMFFKKYRNELEANEIAPAAATSLLMDILPSYSSEARSLLPAGAFTMLSNAAQIALTDIVYNRGAGNVKTYMQPLLNDVADGDYAMAAWDLMNSKTSSGSVWAIAVGATRSEDDLRYLVWSHEGELVEFT